MELFNRPIATQSDALDWLDHAVHTLDLNFHWDTRADEYVNYATRTPTFTPAEAATFEAQLETAMDVLNASGLDPYAIGLDVLLRPADAMELEPLAPATIERILSELATLRRESRYGANMPLLNLDSRASCIAWLVWNDSNGCFTDADCLTEGFQPLTHADARELVVRALTED